MKEKLNEEITIKRWVIIMLVPVMITILGFSYSNVISTNTMKNTVEYTSKRVDQNCHDINQLQKDKADKEQIQRIEKTLERIETYLLTRTK